MPMLVLIQWEHYIEVLQLVYKKDRGLITP